MLFLDRHIVQDQYMLLVDYSNCTVRCSNSFPKMHFTERVSVL